MILVFKHENVQIENIENLKIIEYIKEFDIKNYLFENECNYYIIYNKYKKVRLNIYDLNFNDHCILDEFKSQSYLDNVHIYDMVQNHSLLKNHKECQI